MESAYGSSAVAHSGQHMIAADFRCRNCAPFSKRQLHTLQVACSIDETLQRCELDLLDSLIGCLPVGTKETSGLLAVSIHYKCLCLRCECRN